MLRSEARRILTEAFPDRSVCIEINDWRHAAGVGFEAHSSLNYTIAILPGTDGSKCSHHNGLTMEKAVDHALACKPPFALPTDAEVDQQFAEVPAIAPEPARLAEEIEADPFAGSVPAMDYPDPFTPRPASQPAIEEPEAAALPPGSTAKWVGETR